MTPTTLLEPPAVTEIDTYVETVTVTEVELPTTPPAPVPVPAAEPVTVPATGWVKPWLGLFLVWLMMVATITTMVSGPILSYGD